MDRKKMFHAAMTNVIADMGKHAKAARAERFKRPEMDPAAPLSPHDAAAEREEETGEAPHMAKAVMVDAHATPSETEMEEMLRDMNVQR